MISVHPLGVGGRLIRPRAPVHTADGGRSAGDRTETTRSVGPRRRGGAEPPECRSPAWFIAQRGDPEEKIHRHH